MADRPRRGGGFLLLDLYYASQLSSQLLEEELERVGVRPEWAGLLTEIRTVEPVRSSELARRTGLPPATLYDYLGRLEAEGLIRKEPNPADRRSYFIRTTPKGVRRVHAVTRAVRAAHARFRPLLDRPVTDVEERVTDLRFALEKALNGGATH